MNTSSKSKRSQQGLAQAMDNFLAAPPSGIDRFARAEQVVAQQPTGTSPVALASPHTQAPVGPDGARDDDFFARVHVDQVQDNPLNARKGYSESRITELSASISQHGQLEPAPAARTSDVLRMLQADGGPAALAVATRIDPALPYIQLGGHYRRKAISRLPDPSIKLALTQVRTLLDLYAISYVENDERESTTPMDDALAWQEMLDAGIAKSQEQLAEVTSKKRIEITKTLQLLSLPADVRELLKEAPGKYGLGHAYNLALISKHVTHTELTRLVQQVVDGGISRKELEEHYQRLQAEGGRQPRTKLTSRQHKIVFNGEQVGVIKDWDDGRVQLDVRFEDAAARVKLVEELRERFGLNLEGSQLHLR